MDPVQVAALVAFLLVALVVVIAGRRAGRLLAHTRDAEGFRGRVDDLARRADHSLAGIAKAVDSVRRRTVEPETIREGVAVAREAVERYAKEARDLGGPAVTGPARDAIVAELERAGRALELVDHGCRVLSSSWRGELGAEAQTSIKRGYLNLIHAREGLLRSAADARRLAEAASPARRLGRRIG
jgi:hypothetical protein